MRWGSKTTLVWAFVASVAGFFVAIQPVHVSVLLLLVAVVVVILIWQPVLSLSLLLILSPLRALLLTEAPQLNIIDPGITGLLLVLLLFSLRSVLHRTISTRMLRLNLLQIALLVFMFLTWLSSFAATSYQSWAQDWLKWVLILLLVKITEHQVRYLPFLVISLLVAGTVNAIVGIYIFFGGSGADHLVVMDRFFRAFGTFGQPNPFGGFMGMILPIAITMVIWQFTRIYRLRTLSAGLSFLGVLVPTALMFFALVASWSRGAWLGFAASILILLVAIPRRNLIRLIVVSASTILILFAWSVNLVPASIMERIQEAANQYLSFSDVRGLDINTVTYAGIERISHWQAAINMASASPWIGIGLGNYEVVYDEYRLENWPQALGHAHNYYLNILAEGGIIGILAFLVLWITIFTITWRTRKHPDRFFHWISVGLLGSWTYISIHSLIDNLYVNNLYFHVAAMLAVLSIISNQIEHPQRWRQYDAVLAYKL